jgi:hypothetical protein
MALRKHASTEPGRTAWGSLDWSHAPVSARDYAGPCMHCARPAILKHPVKLVACHKVCDDAHQARQQ